MKIFIQVNKLGDVNYVEPYAGGGGLALNLLFNEYARTIYLNDINKAIYAFWYSAINHSDELCERIEHVQVTLEEREKHKNVIRCPLEHSQLDLGFATIFLNRTNRSGILNGGVIGGKWQQGEWKIDARFNKQTLIKKIKMIAQYKNRIRIFNMDAFEFISDVIPSIRKRAIVYLDPPYFNKGQHLYENYYTPNDHATLSNLVISKITHPWVLSYDNVAPIRKLYAKYRCIKYAIKYSAGDHYEGKEIMYFSDETTIPMAMNPLEISHKVPNDGIRLLPPRPAASLLNVSV